MNNWSDKKDAEKLVTKQEMAARHVAMHPAAAFRPPSHTSGHGSVPGRA